MTRATEPLSALWFGHADRPWSQAALRKLLALVPVRIVPPGKQALCHHVPLPEAVDWLIWEECYPGQIADEQLQELIRRYPLAGVVILQGPWSAAKYLAGKSRLFPAIEVAWHSWPCFLHRLAGHKWVCSDEQAFGQLSANAKPCGKSRSHAHLGERTRPGKSGMQQATDSQQEWVLVRDVELRRLLVEELVGQATPVRWLPVPADPEELCTLGSSGVPRTVYWELGAWFPDAPQRELQRVAHLVRPQRLVGLGVHGWPDLAGAPPELPATEIVLLPLPVPPLAWAELSTAGCWGSARAA